MNDMTKNQKRAYDFICQFWRENQKAPTYREIAASIDREVSQSYQLVQALERGGYVQLQRHKHRTITPVAELTPK